MKEFSGLGPCFNIYMYYFNIFTCCTYMKKTKYSDEEKSF
jgi:hypothetical protein